jgi:uncharacterized integral membrane protein (TIGR00698 family)
MIEGGQMDWLKDAWRGIAMCLLIAVPAWILGKYFPLVGGAVIAILGGMCVAPLIRSQRATREKGIRWVSKKVLQWAVILLGFGLNLSVILRSGAQALPINLAGITTSLVIAYLVQRFCNVPKRIATLIGVGSSICGGSAIAATAPVIDADDDEVAQAISVIFFFNILAALIFPILGTVLGMDTLSGETFGIFAGSAVNDTSSVTAVASTWDSMHQLGSATLQKAVTVKLTRTLAIIPIVLGLSFMNLRKDSSEKGNVSLRKIFPFFVVWFVVAALITTISVRCGVAESVFAPMKALSKFLVVMAMAAIGLNTDIVKLIRSGGKAILLGGACWVGITMVTLLLEALLGLW